MFILGYIYYSANQVVRKSKAISRRQSLIVDAGQAGRQALSAVRNRLARRAAILEINALPDRILRDIGLERAGIEAKVTASINQRDSQTSTSPVRAEAPVRALQTPSCC